MAAMTPAEIIVQKRITAARVRLIPRDSIRRANGSRTKASRAEIMRIFTRSLMNERSEATAARSIRRTIPLNQRVPLFSAGLSNFIPLNRGVGFFIKGVDLFVSSF